MSRTETTHWDAIVVGSGMGGLAAAAALSKAATRCFFWSNTRR